MFKAHLVWFLNFHLIFKFLEREEQSYFSTRVSFWPSSRLTDTCDSTHRSYSSILGYLIRSFDTCEWFLLHICYEWSSPIPWSFSYDFKPHQFSTLKLGSKFRNLGWGPASCFQTPSHSSDWVVACEFSTQRFFFAVKINIPVLSFFPFPEFFSCIINTQLACFRIAVDSFHNLPQFGLIFPVPEKGGQSYFHTLRFFSSFIDGLPLNLWSLHFLAPRLIFY